MAFNRYVARLSYCLKDWNETRKKDGSPHPTLFGAYRYPFGLVCNMGYGERKTVDSDSERLGEYRQEVSAAARAVELVLLRSSSLVYSAKKKADYVTAPITITQIETQLGLGRKGKSVVNSGIAELIDRNVITATQTQLNHFIYKQKANMGTSADGDRENYLMLFPEEIDLLLSAQCRSDVKLNLINVWLIVLARSVTSKKELDAAWVPVSQIANGCQLEAKAVSKRLDDLIHILLLSRKGGLVRINDDKAKKHFYYARPWADFDLENRLVKDVRLGRISRTFLIPKDQEWMSRSQQNIDKLLYSVDEKTENNSLVADVS